MPTFEESIRASGGIDLHRQKAAPDVAPANSARVYYDADQGALQVSNNGGAYSSFADLTAAGVTATATEINKLHSVTAGTAAASKVAVLGTNKNLDILALPVSGLKIGAGAGTAVTASAAELNVLTGQSGTPVQCAQVTFTETAGAGVYTGSVSVPAGATILDVIVNGVALWNPATSASMDVGDTDADGFFAAIDLMATDLLAGESLSLLAAGGKQGAYIANSQVSPRYSASARTVSGVITTVGGAGTTGRTRLSVYWSNPTATAAVKV